MSLKLGITREAHSISVIDADTVRVTFIEEVDIRLEPEVGIYDAPEIFHPKSKEEKTLGLEAKKYLEEKLAAGGKIVVHIPFKGRNKVKDIITVGRIAGKVYLNNENIVDEKMKTEYSKECIVTNKPSKQA